MTKSNIILQAAVTSALLAMSTAALAGNMATTTRTFATENFGPNQTSTVAFTPAATSYAISSGGGVTVSSAQTITLYLRLSGGVFVTAPSAANFSNLSLGAAGTQIAPTITWATGSSANTIAATYTSSNTTSTNFPVNTTIIYSPASGAVAATSSTLSTAGGVVSIIGSLSGAAVSTSATTLPGDQDPVSTPVNVALSAQAVSGAVQSSAAFTSVAETKKIDLAATTGSATAFSPTTSTLSNTTVSNIVNLGSYTFTNNAAVTPTDLTGANYALQTTNTGSLAPFAGTTVTIAPGASQSWPVGAQFATYTDKACTATSSALSTAITATTAQTSITVSTSLAGNLVPGTKVAQYVCMTAATSAAMTPLNPTIAVTLTKTLSTDATDAIAATAAYPLAYNGSQIDVRNYVPTLVTGWSTVLRIINTGAITAPISAALINETTGVVGTAVTLVTSLASGAAATVNGTAIEAAFPSGSFTSASRPRIRITAPTNSLSVQTYVFNPNGNFSIIHGSE